VAFVTVEKGVLVARGVFQRIVLEFVRNVLGYTDAEHTEANSHPWPKEDATRTVALNARGTARSGNESHSMTN
jgi:hypothetical protein